MRTGLRSQYKTAKDITDDVVFMSRVRIDETTGCWVWTATLFTKGYARIKRYGKDMPAHVWAWELRNGKTPEGKELDHLCRNRACVNPDHLEAVTHRVNVERGMCSTAAKMRQTHCIRGHPLSGENLFIRRNGHRACWICHKEHSRRSHLTPEYRVRHAELERIRRWKKKELKDL